MKKATTLSAALGLTASLTLAGCAGAGSSAGSVSTTLTIALTSQPNSLDPAQSATGAYLSYIDPAYATLLTLNSDGSIADFECLCTRCLQAERVVSDRVTLTVGRAQLVYTPGEEHPRTTKFKAANF